MLNHVHKLCNTFNLVIIPELIVIIQVAQGLIVRKVDDRSNGVTQLSITVLRFLDQDSPIHGFNFGADIKHLFHVLLGDGLKHPESLFIDQVQGHQRIFICFRIAGGTLEREIFRSRARPRARTIHIVRVRILGTILSFVRARIVIIVFIRIRRFFLVRLSRRRGGAIQDILDIL